jgi:hypothetical protein
MMAVTENIDVGPAGIGGRLPAFKFLASGLVGLHIRVPKMARH